MTTTDIGLESRTFCRLLPSRLFGWFVWCLAAFTAQIGYIMSCPPRNSILLRTYSRQTDERSPSAFRANTDTEADAYYHKLITYLLTYLLPSIFSRFKPLFVDR